MPTVRFAPADKEIDVAEGTLILEAAQACGVNINVPCGGQGRCGRCAVIVEDGADGQAFGGVPPCGCPRPISPRATRWPASP